MSQQSHSSRIGRYVIDGVLGQGGMGYVYRAVCPGTGRSVALKLLNPAGMMAGFLDDAELRALFTAEIQTMSRLHHPNIAEVLDADFAGDRPFYTMEFFCNNLGMMIGERFVVEEPSRRIPPEKALNYGHQVLAGLGCMHQAGIIHRDIKPFNMMVTETDTIKICDFGLARLEDEESFSPEGINIGSPYYAAPEQISDPEHADARADLYSAGVLLYRMLTGELPAMKDFMLSHIDPLYDQAWDAFFARALSWKPSLRFQSAKEMAAALSRLELHRQEQSAQKSCPPLSPAAGAGGKHSPRSRPVRTSGSTARELFEVDRLWQPRTRIGNHFRQHGDRTVRDEATGLIWQQGESGSLLDRESAERFIAGLNNDRFGGIATWRLPTVNELLSLAASPSLSPADCRETPLAEGRDWFWSCDRRSADTSWYVNTGLGYAGWQHDSCLYGVRGVASSPG